MPGLDPASLPEPFRMKVSLPSLTVAPAIGRRSLAAVEPFAAPEALDDARLLVSELVTNSVRHGVAGPHDHIDLTVEVLPHLVRIQVRDVGGGFDYRPPAPADRSDGWGLFLVEQLSDRWGIERVQGNGTAVWFELGLAGAA